MDLEFEVSDHLTRLLDNSYDVAIVGDGSSTGGYGPVGSAGLVIHPPLVLEVVSAVNYGSNIESELATYIQCLIKLIDYPEEFGLERDRVGSNVNARNKYSLIIVTDNQYVYRGSNDLCSVDSFEGYWHSYSKMSDNFITTVIRADRNSFKELSYVDERAREAKKHFSEI